MLNSTKKIDGLIYNRGITLADPREAKRIAKIARKQGNSVRIIPHILKVGNKQSYMRYTLYFRAMR